MQHQNLEIDKYYHIFNKARFEETLFREDMNYEYFIDLYKKYISPNFETFAWTLLGNHFHLLVKTKEIETTKPLHQYFSNLFNAYTKAFNKKYKRNGPLFVSPFKRIEIRDEKYMKNLISYINLNSVHHKFVDNIEDYQWTSYHSVLMNDNSIVKRDNVIQWFNNDINEFVEFHDNKKEDIELKQLIVE